MSTCSQPGRRGGGGGEPTETERALIHNTSTIKAPLQAGTKCKIKRSAMTVHIKKRKEVRLFVFDGFEAVAVPSKFCQWTEETESIQPNQGKI